MKLNLNKNWYYAGAALLVTLCIILFWGLNREASPGMAKNTGETSTEPQASTEMVTNTLEHDYFYDRPKLKRRVIAIRELGGSELPAPFDFTQYGKESYKDRHFYAVVILDIDTDVRLNTETITEAAQLEILSTLEAPGIEQIYKQLEIRYEDGYAVYKHDRQFFVTSLIEPRLFKKFAIYDEMIPIEPNNDNAMIDVYRTPLKRVFYSISEKQFLELPDNKVQPKIDAFTFEGKIITHKPSLTSVQGPSFSYITEEPRLNKFTLGSSSSVIFERLGKPNTVDWLMGHYLNYEDLLIYSTMEEKGDALTFHPAHAVLYFGEYPVAGIQKGMSFKEVEQILGPQSALYFSENNEMTYPLSTGFNKDGFSIRLGFDTELKVSQFYIRSAESEEDQSGPIYEPMPNEVIKAFSEDLFSINGLEAFTDFATGFNTCYFNASAVTSSVSDPTFTGFYTYDLSREAPILISDQPMKMVFELLYDANPSVITIGKEDGVLYKIDLNTFAVTPLSGPNYKDYLVRDGAVIKVSFFSDATFLGNYGLAAKETIGKFEVSIPKDWHVKYGDYPEGLYWSLANVFSKDIGLDLSPLKGKTVEATVYRLETGLRAHEGKTTFEYPSNVVILREDDAIKGAWLTFNSMAIGPSLDLNYLEDITGETFDNWVWDEGIFAMTTSYLPSPDATVNAFFDAIQSGNKPKADACLTPGSFRDSLTSNLDFSKRLYHEDFNANNSMTQNIVSASDVEIVAYFGNASLKPIENSQVYYDAMPLGTRIEVEISLNLEWKEIGFNTDGKDTRYTMLIKTPYGWKMEGLGTGR